LITLGCGDRAGSDESDSRVYLSINDKQKAPLRGQTDDDETVLLVGVLVVREGGAERVVEDGDGLVRLLAALSGSNLKVRRKGVMRSP